jgi:flagellar motor switch/type III secretory pathway protein FliN
MSAATGQARSGSMNEPVRGSTTAEEEDVRWRPVLRLPCQLTVELPLPSFKVSDFLGLRAGTVIGTRWRLAQDVPLRANGILIGWGEFEGAGGRLAVRLTELA